MITALDVKPNEIIGLFPIIFYLRENSSHAQKTLILLLSCGKDGQKGWWRKIGDEVAN